MAVSLYSTLFLLFIVISSPCLAINTISDGPNMQCETFITECINLWTGAVSCKEPGYLGCFSDHDRYGPGRDRVLSDGPREYEYILTIDLCIKACEEDGFFYAGVEDGDQCFCGRQDENLVRHGRDSDEDCEYVCGGDRLESCGGSAEIAIYQVDLGVCEDPGTPQNGFRYNETGSLRYGSKIYFNCSDDFTLEGPDVIQCVQVYGSRYNVGIGNITHAVMWNHVLPQCTGFSSNTPSSATTKGRGLTNQIPFSGTTGPEQKSGHRVIISISIGIVSGLLIIAIIVVVVICKIHRRRSNIALKQSVSDREGQELDPYTSLDTTTMKQPAYEDIKATSHGNRGHTNATEGVEYENQRIVEQTARVKKSNLGVPDENTEPEYEMLN